MSEQITTYDPAAALDTPEAIDIFLNDAFETEDPSYIAEALGLIARSQGMSNISKKTQLNREQLYKTLSREGNPTIQTVIKVMKTMGLVLTFKHSVQTSL